MRVSIYTVGIYRHMPLCKYNIVLIMSRYNINYVYYKYCRKAIQRIPTCNIFKCAYLSD